MDSIFETSLLLDFYGQLLTERQHTMLDLYYNRDYSLGEIAEYFGISRQGVHDSIKSGKESLDRFEQKLGLVRRFVANIERIRQIKNLLGSIDRSRLSGADTEKLEQVEKIIDEIINDME